MNIWNRIVEWFSDRSERDRLVRNFNNSAKEAFINGIVLPLRFPVFIIDKRKF